MVIKRHFFVKWFETHGRDFPWRTQQTTPFQFLITEILLQQTKAVDVAIIWHDFFKEFPNPAILTQANTEKLNTMINFLGFGARRAKALKEIGAWLTINYDRNVPSDLNQLLTIPFVGPYAAHAVLCFAFDRKIEIVDANVIRLFNRCI